MLKLRAHFRSHFLAELEGAQGAASM